METVLGMNVMVIKQKPIFLFYSKSPPIFLNKNPNILFFFSSIFLQVANFWLHLIVLKIISTSIYSRGRIDPGTCDLSFPSQISSSDWLLFCHTLIVYHSIWSINNKISLLIVPTFVNIYLLF